MARDVAFLKNAVEVEFSKIVWSARELCRGLAWSWFLFLDGPIFNTRAYKAISRVRKA